MADKTPVNDVGEIPPGHPHHAPVRAVSTVKLPLRIQRFVEEYAIDFNGTAAAIRAGYAHSHAHNQAYELLRKPEVEQALREELLKRTTRTRITQDMALRELALLAFSNRADYVLGEDGEIYLANEFVDPGAIRAVQSHTHKRRVVNRKVSGEGIEETSEIEKDFRLYDKRASLALLFQHLGMVKQPTPAQEVDAINEFLAKLPPELADDFRRIISGFISGRGIDAGIPAEEGPAQIGDGPREVPG